MMKMSKFIKPKTEYVSAKEYISNLINANMRKDLHDNEEICSYCAGTGMVIRDNPYGLSNDPDKIVGIFPYKHQSLTFCPRCYDGIIHRCKLCGGIIQRGFLKHNCKEQLEIDRRESDRKRAQALKDAPLASPEVLEKSYFFYSDDFGYNDGYFDDWGEFFDYWHENGEINGDRIPEFVWATEPVEMSIDAENIIENATEELYEDADYDIPQEKRKELQEFLDNWCKTCGVNTTYVESKYKVRVPWELADE